MIHSCPGCGLEHDAAQEVEPPSEETVETVTEASVAIAQIEADRDVTLAKIAAKTEEGWQESRIADLEGQLHGIRETLDRIAPPQPEEPTEPETIIVDAPPEPEPVMEDVAEPPAPEPSEPKPTKKKSAWW